jgi:hypothetical protein
MVIVRDVFQLLGWRSVCFGWANSAPVGAVTSALAAPMRNLGGASLESPDTARIPRRPGCCWTGALTLPTPGSWQIRVRTRTRLGHGRHSTWGALPPLDSSVLLRGLLVKSPSEMRHGAS